MGISISAEEYFGLGGQASISNEGGPANERKVSPKTYAERRRKVARAVLKDKEFLKHALNDMMESRAQEIEKIENMHRENAGSNSEACNVQGNLKDSFLMLADASSVSLSSMKASRKPKVGNEVNSVLQSTGERLEESEASTADPSSESSFSQVTTYLVGIDAAVVGFSLRSLPPKLPLVVGTIHPGTWAYTMDIKPGDELVSIEDRDVGEMQREEFMQLMQRRPLHFCMARNTELEEAENEFFPDSFSPRKSISDIPVFDMAANDDPCQSARRHSCH